MRSHLLEGRVRHHRRRPFVYRLEHSVWYLALDLDEVNAIAARLRLLSRNGRGIVEFRDADHLMPPAGDVAAAVRDRLRGLGEDPNGWELTLVAYPRVLGHVFNPASFFLCRDPAGELRVVLVEVHNTHLERRVYELRPERHGDRHVASMAKDFYVSPFIGMAADYTVRIHDAPSRLRITIAEREAGEPLLDASIDVRRRPLTDRNLARMLLGHPLVTLKTIGLIHWHAFHLWRRGLPFLRHRGTAGARPE